MTFDELKEKALSLPYAPGVYIMRDKTDKVIYVGKAKKLKNRVSQYFQDTASHTPKTRLMVSKIHHFDVIVAASEFEALVLECSLIKRYMPKYNILLKDDKGYPYLRLNMKDIYPVITMVSKPADDGADYYGPYGGRAVTHDVMEAIRLTLKLPGCHKQFPRDIGKERPCLNYHMNQCAGWCQENKSCTEYRETMLQARELLKGNYKAVAEQLRGQMLSAADNLEFELAASFSNKTNKIRILVESPNTLNNSAKSYNSSSLGILSLSVSVNLHMNNYSYVHYMQDNIKSQPLLSFNFYFYIRCLFTAVTRCCLYINRLFLSGLLCLKDTFF